MKTDKRNQECTGNSKRLTSTTLGMRPSKSLRGSSYFYTIALLCLSLAASITFVSCNNVRDKDLECKSYIKLLVYLPHQYGTKPLRAEGPVTEKNDLSHSTEKGLSPNKEAVWDLERHVSRLLVVLKDANDNVVFAKTFNNGSSLSYDGGLNPFIASDPDQDVNGAPPPPAATNQPFDYHTTIIIGVEPGQYKLQTWANLPEAGYTPNNVYTTDTFKDEATLKNLADPQGNTTLGLPMSSAVQTIKVKPGITVEDFITGLVPIYAGNNTTKNEDPSHNIFHVDLERMISKVEVNLRNTDDKGAVFPESKNATIKSVELVNANKNYKMSGFPDEALIPSTDTKVSVTHNKGEAYNQEKVLSLYMAPRTGVTKATATAVRITATIFNEENVYTIPLYDQETPGTDPKKYDIVRNTIYRINARLKGHEIVFDTPVLVEGWYVESPKKITIEKEGLTNE